MAEQFTTRLNVMTVSSMSTFANIKGGFRKGCKDVYFYRLLGISGNYVRQIREMDEMLNARMQAGAVSYKRIRELPKVGVGDEMAVYIRIYKEWLESGRTSLAFPSLKDARFREVLSIACSRVLEQYRSINPNSNDSQEQNFIIKLLFWLDRLLAGWLTAWTEGKSIKLVSENVNKKQEYLFYIFLTFLGFDVMLLQYKTDISEELERLNLSGKCVIGSFSDAAVPPYEYHEKKPAAAPPQRAERTDRGNMRERIVPPQRASQAYVQERIVPTQQTGQEGRREKTYEELAMLSSSVVMIAIHNRKGDIIGTGSGIMLNKDGYILTNNHVASGGAFYSVKIEDDEQAYTTDEIIKYNPDMDLALIRIDRCFNPLQIYRGSRLVRGQRVVAIGSPLGLFNSISDGIIAGFRKINNVDMIQFTAPISHGSSGGALMNMYGEVIGISTAGFDDGQNINLAVGYECIRMFAGGFVQ